MTATMTTTIAWSQIEAECGDYRAGFVETFRKYEGQATDERDGSNRIVKVTKASFERHFGLGRGTLDRWIQVTDQEVARTPARSHAGAARRFAGKLPTEEKAKLAAELLEDEAVADAPEVQRITTRHANRRLVQDSQEFRHAGGTDEPDPFPADLVADATGIRHRIYGAVSDIDRLMDRAEPDQRARLVGIIRPAVNDVLEHLDVGSATVPDFVPDNL